MASNLTFDDLTAKVRRQLQDAEGNYWTDAEIHEYLDEGQLEYARKTRALRGSAPITVKENNETYRLPEDCLEVIRLEDSAGNEIPRATSDGIQRSTGNFRNRTAGVPASLATAIQWGYSDLDGQGLIKFTPAPNPTMEEVGVVFQPYRRFAFTRSGYNFLHVFSDNYLYISDDDYIYQYSLLDESFLEPTGLNMTIASPLTNLDFVRIPYNEFDSKSGYWLVFDVGVATTYSIYTTFQASPPAPPSGNLVSAASSVGPVISPVSYGGSSYVIVQIGTTIKAIRTSNYSLVTLATGLAANSVQQWAYQESTRTVYAATADGLLSITLAQILAGSTMTTITASAARCVCVANDDVYVTLASDGTILYKLVDGALVAYITSTLANMDGTARTLVYDGASYLLGVGANDVYGNETGVVFDIIKGTTVTTQIAIDRGFMFPPLASGLASGYNGRFIGIDKNLTVSYSEGERGAVCVFNDIIDGTGVGEIVDFESSAEDDIIKFDGDDGCLCQAIQSATGLHVYYVRSPREGLVEVTDTVALTHYALYKCYEKDGDKTAMERAMYHLGQFQNILRRDMRRSSEGFINASPSVQGYHF